MVRKFTFIFYFIFFVFINFAASANEPGSKGKAKQKSVPGKDFLQVLPNPGNGIYTVVFKSDQKGQIMLAVSDATGKYVYLKTIKDFNGELKETVDLSGNPKGIYIFEAETESNRESKKIIFQ